MSVKQEEQEQEQQQQQQQVPTEREDSTEQEDDEQEGAVAAAAQEGGKTSEQELELLHIKVDEESVEANSLRIFSLEEIPLERLTQCKLLSIRKNLIHYLDTPFPKALAEQLLELDLFDNKIKKVPLSYFSDEAAPFCSLTKLDLSYNQIKRIEGFDALAGTLEELYLVENRIKVIENLDKLTNLRLLELGGNQIREVGDGLLKLTNLEQLWLGKNKINNFKGSFRTLNKLKRLSLQANRITQLQPQDFGVLAAGYRSNNTDVATATAAAESGDATTATDCFPSKLQELYLSENGITKMEHLEALHGVEILDFSFNPIKIIEGIDPQCQTCLEDFWLTDGKIDDWSQVDKLKVFEKTLTTVYLERNPIEHDKRYRDKVFMALPCLNQIDSWPIVNRQNLEADRAIRRKEQE